MEYTYPEVPVPFREEDRERYKKGELTMELLEDPKWKDDPRVKFLLQERFLDDKRVPFYKGVPLKVLRREFADFLKDKPPLFNNGVLNPIVLRQFRDFLEHKDVGSYEETIGGFDQLWIGKRLLEQRRPRLTAMCDYLYVKKYPEDHWRYDKALRLLLGPCASRILTRQQGQPPDFLVFDSEDRFFFCEAKEVKKAFADDQRSNFERIEDCLNKHKPPCGSALDLANPIVRELAESARQALAGHWIHVLRLRQKT